MRIFTHVSMEEAELIINHVASIVRHWCPVVASRTLTHESLALTRARCRTATLEETMQQIQTGSLPSFLFWMGIFAEAIFFEQTQQLLEEFDWSERTRPRLIIS